jgi:hypothetical protein
VTYNDHDRIIEECRLRGQKAEVGARRVAPNGYHYYKTEKGWRLTHHVVWERTTKKPIPPGFQVRFKNGDKNDYVFDNLVLVEMKPKSKAYKASLLRAKIAELQAELKILEAE